MVINSKKIRVQKIENKNKNLVLSELKVVKRIMTILGIVTIIISIIINFNSIYHYNQLINKEKVFLKQADNLISKIELHNHFGE